MITYTILYICMYNNIYDIPNFIYKFIWLSVSFIYLFTFYFEEKNKYYTPSNIFRFFKELVCGKTLSFALRQLCGYENRYKVSNTIEQFRNHSILDTMRQWNIGCLIQSRGSARITVFHFFSRIKKKTPLFVLVI